MTRGWETKRLWARWNATIWRGPDGRCVGWCADTGTDASVAISHLAGQAAWAFLSHLFVIWGCSIEFEALHCGLLLAADDIILITHRPEHALDRSGCSHADARLVLDTFSVQPLLHRHRQKPDAREQIHHHHHWVMWFMASGSCMRSATAMHRTCCPSWTEPRQSQVRQKVEREHGRKTTTCWTEMRIYTRMDVSSRFQLVQIVRTTLFRHLPMINVPPYCSVIHNK